jgi:hypothetical protein
MDEIFIGVMQRLQQAADLQLVGEDWGQLNLEQPPVNFPCALIDLGEVAYSNAGQDTQRAEAIMNITVADICYNGINLFNPEDANRQEFDMFRLLDDINALIHGFGTQLHSKFVRTRIDRIMRDDAVRMFVISYKFAFSDEITAPEYVAHPVPVRLQVSAK